MRSYVFLTLFGGMFFFIFAKLDVVRKLICQFLQGCSFYLVKRLFIVFWVAGDSWRPGDILEEVAFGGRQLFEKHRHQLISEGPQP